MSRVDKHARVRLLAKGYKLDPFVCSTCKSEMKVIAIIQEFDEIRRISAHSGRMAEQHAERAARLVKIGRSPPVPVKCSLETATATF